MSANNYLIILRPAKTKYEVWEVDADTAVTVAGPRQAKTLEEALKKAMKWIDEEEIEYGIKYIEFESGWRKEVA